LSPSASQLANEKIPFVILGHSERRSLETFKETSHEVAEKTQAALEKGLQVILCIGETQKNRDDGETMKVCEEQLSAVMDKIKHKPEEWRSVS
jgi:triosephosphate isomerase (TIM)